MIGRWLLYGTTSWCFLIGVWRHDWLLIVASIGLAVLFSFLAVEVRRDV